MTHRLTRMATLRSPLARRLRNILIAVAGRGGRLPRQLATDLAQIGTVYRDGWSVDDATTVERWASKSDEPVSGLDPALRLVVPDGYEASAIADAARYPVVPVRVVAGSDRSEATIVRPDDYVAGRGAPGDYAQLLGLLAQALKEETL